MDFENKQPTDSNKPTQKALSNEKTTDGGELDYSKLTHQNWLFINGFLQTSDILKSYQLAKYSGNDASAPYQVFKRLKPFIEAIGDLDVTSRARLQANVKGLLALPLDPEKKYLTFSEMLRLNKFVASLTPDANTQKQSISVLVINRAKHSDAATPSNGTHNASDPLPKDVIDAEIIE